jgi:GGDEF domain-containing protein
VGEPVAAEPADAADAPEHPEPVAATPDEPADPAVVVPTDEAAGPPPTRRVGPTGSEALVDPETGLFSQDYFGVAIEARVAAARRHLRPVAVVLLEVVRGVRDARPVRCLPLEVADGIRATLREADTACRMDDGVFALVLEDTPENGAIWTVERIRRLLVGADPGRTLWAGVACYPAHAFDSDSLLVQAQHALRAARDWQQDRIEVAVPE